MSDYLKWMKYRDEELHLKKTLDEIVNRAKKVNSDYQSYLQKNPYKQEKNTLKRKKEEYVKKILDLIQKGWEGGKKNGNS